MIKVNQLFYKLLQVFDLIFCLTWIFHGGRTHYVIGVIDCSLLWKFFFKQIYHSERLLHDYPVMQFEIKFSKRSGKTLNIKCDKILSDIFTHENPKYYITAIFRCPITQINTLRKSSKGLSL